MPTNQNPRLTLRNKRKLSGKNDAAAEENTPATKRIASQPEMSKTAKRLLATYIERLLRLPKSRDLPSHKELIAVIMDGKIDAESQERLERLIEKTRLPDVATISAMKETLNLGSHEHDTAIEEQKLASGEAAVIKTPHQNLIPQQGDESAAFIDDFTHPSTITMSMASKQVLNEFVNTLMKQQTDLWEESWNFVRSLEPDEATQHNLLAIVARTRVLIDAILMEMTENLGLNPDHLTTTQGEQNEVRFFSDKEFLNMKETLG